MSGLTRSNGFGKILFDTHCALQYIKILFHCFFSPVECCCIFCLGKTKLLASLIAHLFFAGAACETTLKKRDMLFVVDVNTLKTVIYNKLNALHISPATQDNHSLLNNAIGK